VNDDIAAFEAHLHQLYDRVETPPAPQSWRRRAAATGAVARSPRRWRWRLAHRAALVAALVVALVALAVANGRRAPAPSPSAVSLSVTVLPAGASLSCRLPISALSADHTTGFVVLDHGRATFEPVHTQGTTYVEMLGRWLDILPQFVAPDGQSYVYTEDRSDRSVVHLVDARGDRVILDTAQHIGPFAYTSEGILLGGTSSDAASRFALAWLDPVSGRITQPARQIPEGPDDAPRTLSSEIGYVRGTDAVWIMAYTGTRSTLDRYDLRTGAVTRWYDGPGNVQVVGGDGQSRPIVQVADRDLFHTDPAHRDGIQVQTLLLTAPNHPTVLNQGSVGQPGVVGDLSPLSVTDGDTVWLATDDGAILRYRPATGLQQVAKVTTSTSGSPGVVISGPCR
jgi:hypothetical protein